MRTHFVPFVTGLLLSLGVHRANGWWLNSGGGVALMLLILGAAAAVVARQVGSPPVRPAASLWAGSLLGMMIVMFVTGAGSIWPIVLVVAGGLSAAAVAVGALAGRAIGSARRTHR